MHRKFYQICLWILVVIFQLNALELIGTETKGDPQLQELVFKVSSKDISIDDEGIIVNINEIPYSVRSLKRDGDQWVAKVNSRVDGLDYCPRNHPLCRGCGLCHKENCEYFVRHCSLWR